MPLKLRRPRDHRDTPGNPDDYDVLIGERRIGRILWDTVDHGRNGHDERVLTARITLVATCE
jgi:hypothetical protein